MSKEEKIAGSVVKINATLNKIADVTVEGYTDPLAILLELNKVESVLKKALDDVKKIALEEVEKMDKGEVRHGLEWSIMPPVNIWDYSKDPVVKELETAIKKRKDVIKPLCGTTRQIVDEETGEMIGGVPLKSTRSAFVKKVKPKK